MADEETNIRRPYAELGLVWLQIWQTLERLIPLTNPRQFDILQSGRTWLAGNQMQFNQQRGPRTGGGT